MPAAPDRARRLDDAGLRWRLGDQLHPSVAPSQGAPGLPRLQPVLELRHPGLTKEKLGFWTRRRAFEQVRHGSNIQLLSYSLVTASLLFSTVQPVPPSATKSARLAMTLA